MSEFYQRLLRFLQEQLQQRLLERVPRDQETPEMSAHLFTL
jgi:hypothetical protein